MEKKYNFPQRCLVLWHLQEGGTLTHMEALTPEFGFCSRLASVVNRLREQGWNIQTQMVERESAYGTKRFARYFLAEEDRQK